jgi:DNA processing protein
MGKKSNVFYYDVRMDIDLLALAFTTLHWKEARKAEVWEEYRANESPALSPEERKELDSLSNKIKSLRDEAVSLGANLVLPGDAKAAHLQEELPYPVALWAQGTLPPPSACLAVVGSRASSEGGRKRALRIGRDLTEAGVGVISGLARGIDAAAHVGAIEVGPTWGILGSGLKNPYPAENIPLMNRIVKTGGGVITCFPPDAKPHKWHFPRRNLLMAAWTKGVVVVEAGARSGSLLTARLALDLGKEVWAIPGSPDDTHSEGTNAFLREGAAKFARGAKDILEDLSSLF